VLTYYNSCGKITVLKVRNENLKNMKNISDITGYDYNDKDGFFPISNSTATPNNRTILKNASDRKISNAMNPSLKHRWDAKKKRQVREISDKISAEDIKKQKLKNEFESANSAISHKQLEKKLKKESKKKSKHLRNMMLEPFKAKVAEIANTIESRRIAMMYIIKGATNQGKTYTSAKFAVPYLMKKQGVDVVFYTYPQNEIFNKNEWRTKGYKIIAIGENDQRISSQIDSLLDDIENDVDPVKYVIAMTNKTLACAKSSTNRESHGKYLAKKLHSLGKKMAFILDECHTWTISHIDAYTDVTGNTGVPPQYDASLFKFVAWLSKYTKFLFGLTATPNFEQTGLRDTIKKEAKLDYSVINEFPEREDLLHGQAWSKKFDFMDMKNENDIQTKIRNITREHLSDNMTLSAAGLKGTMFIQSNTEKSTNNKAFDVMDRMKTVVKDLLITDDTIDDIYDYLNPETASFAIISSHDDWQGVYSLGSASRPYDRLGGYLTETEIYKRLGNPNDPLTFLIAVQKGKMGLSVHSFRSLISFKNTEKKGKDDDNNSIIVTTMHVQTLGRMPRLYVRPDNKNYVKEFGYSTFEYIARANESELSILKLSNSYNVLVADSQTWRESVACFNKHYGTSLEMAEKEIDKVRAEYPKANQIPVNHNLPINGGIVSNKNGFILEAKVCQALIFQVEELNEKLGLTGNDIYRVHYFKYKKLLPLIDSKYHYLIASYPTDKTPGGHRKILSNKNEGGEYSIDLDAYIATQNDPFDIAIGFTIKNATKDQNGDGLLNGLTAMEVDLGFPGIAIVNLYSVDEKKTQKKSNTFANKKSSNTYDKFKFNQHKYKNSLESENFKIFGLNDRSDYEKINSDFRDMIGYYYDEGSAEIDRLVTNHHTELKEIPTKIPRRGVDLIFS